jgi:hypothetical protein
MVSAIGTYTVGLRDRCGGASAMNHRTRLAASVVESRMQTRATTPFGEIAGQFWAAYDGVRD